MRQVMHGDRIAVRVTGEDPRGRKEGALVEVLDGEQPLDAPTALRDVLGWKHGRLWFRPEKVADPGPDARRSIGMLLLEAVRLEDEAGR